MIWLKLNDFSKNEELIYWNTDSNSIENGLSADYRLENASNLGVYQTIESYNFYNDIHAYWTMNQPLLSLENENYFFYDRHNWSGPKYRGIWETLFDSEIEFLRGFLV